MLKHVQEFILDRDIYGPTVELVFKGNNRFRSMRGGLIALFCQILVVFQFIAPITQFITRENPFVSTYKLISKPEGSFKMADSKQVIALQFNNGDENLAELDPTYGVIGAYYLNSAGNIAKSLPPVRCDYDKHFA